MKMNRGSSQARRRDRQVVSAQIGLALASVGSLFIPSRDYPLLLSVNSAEIRVQDLLFIGFVLALVLGPGATREALRRAMFTAPAVCAGAFLTLVVLSLAQVPRTEIAPSAIAVGKLIEFAVVGALAGVVLISAGQFPAFVAVLGLGVAVNTGFSLWRSADDVGLEALTSVRPGGFLGPDILATGGAVAVVAGLALIGSPRRNRPIAIGGIAAGGLAILAGRSILAAAALIVGLAALFLVLRQRVTGVAIGISLALLAVVLTARLSDLGGLTRILDTPTVGAAQVGPEAFFPAVNYLSNGGCEIGTDGWSTNGEHVTLEVGRNKRRFGSASCNVRTPGLIRGEGVFHPGVAVAPAGTYSLSAWILAPRGVTIALGVEWLGTKHQLLFGAATVTRGDGLWRRVKVTSTSPSNVAFARATIYSRQRGRAVTFSVDGVLLQQGNPTPYGHGGEEPPINVVANDGCEVNTTGWNANPERVAILRDLVERRVGASACRVSTPGESRGEGVFHERIPVTGGTYYLLASWIRAPIGSRLALRIEWLAESGNVLSVSSGSFPGTGAWGVRRLLASRAPQASIWARPTIYTAGSPQRITFHVDGAFFGTRRLVSEALFANGSLSHRVLVSYIGSRIAADHAFTGVGWQQGGSQRFMADPGYERAARRLFPAIDPDLYPSRFPTHSHSAYIQTAADAGIAALAAFVAMAIAALGRTLRATRRTTPEVRAYAGGIAAMVVTIAFWFNSTPFFGGSLEVGLFWCLVGMAASIPAGHTPSWDAASTGTSTQRKPLMITKNEPPDRLGRGPTTVRTPSSGDGSR